MDDMKPPYFADKQCYPNERCSIARLPTELFITTLLLVLPSIDEIDHEGECEDYMTQLYAFRLVSKHWRGVIDSTPFMWPLISSALPAQVNDTSVLRSLNIPLAVIYDIVPRNEYRIMESDRLRELQTDVASARNFMEWADVVRHRWASVTFKLAGSVASKLLEKPAPQLKSLTILLYQRSLASIPKINLFGGCTEQIRHVKIDRVGGGYVPLEHIPMFWPSGAFKGLKSLHLGHIWSASLTTRYILEVLRASPELESLTLKRNVIQDNSSNAELPQVVLPCLRTLRYSPNYGSQMDQTLGHVTLLPNSIEYISITDYEYVSQMVDTPFDEFLTTGLISLAPALRRLHERCGGSTLTFYRSSQRTKAKACWDGRLGDLKLRIHIPAISPSIALQWVDRVLCLAKPGIKVAVPEGYLSGDSIGAMQSMQCVEKLLVYSCRMIGTTSVPQLLDALGESSAASP
ncbi:hypothetical protein FRC01_008901, partial [Tulasnella sp. 417]